LVFLLGRFLVDDDADAAEVAAISREVSLRPLSALTGDDAPAPPPPLGEPAGTPQTIPTDASFYDELGEALSINPPPTPAQDALFAALDARGLGSGSDGSASSSTSSTSTPPPAASAVRATLDEAAA